MKDDWDSYGAKPISTLALVEAADLIFCCPDAIVFVAPCPNGAVLIEYQHRGRSLEVEIHGESQYGILWTEGPMRCHRSWERDGMTFEEARVLIDIFTSDVLTEGGYT